VIDCSLFTLLFGYGDRAFVGYYFDLLTFTIPYSLRSFTFDCAVGWLVLFVGWLFAPGSVGCLCGYLYVYPVTVTLRWLPFTVIYLWFYVPR
jgi:hypothetical protein